MQNKLGLITEKEVNDIAIAKYKHNINLQQEKEKALSQLPYSDEFPRLSTLKQGTCHSVVLRTFYISLVCSCLYSRIFTMNSYNYSYSKLRSYKKLPSIFFMIFTSRLLFIDFRHPFCQSINRGDMSSSTDEEEVFKYLIEKCDIYDHIDALLELKDKYTIYELEQLQKEFKIQNSKITAENMEKFREKRRDTV